MAPEHIPTYLTPPQVARNWGVSVRTVYRYIASGRLKAIRLPGGQFRVRLQDAEAAIVEASA
ncbi:helix-turn-helix domain-containing protein [Mycobacterium malmoense]|uniref:helix-turn-helix domain-containing protein n=1 Tax=Mycobacterium malmoense TaxID=1780 RepID=UPI0015A6F9B1|nr:helix-turn-helix domain-containing protein [Mycobacterium malmoense]